jgi:acyl dehydratase
MFGKTLAKVAPRAARVASGATFRAHAAALSSLAAPLPAVFAPTPAAARVPTRAFSGPASAAATIPSAPPSAAANAANAAAAGTPPHLSPTVLGEVYTQYLDCSSATVGMPLESPYEVTFTAADRVAHQSTFYEFNRIYTSAAFAKGVGFADVPLPGSLLMSHAAAMSHVDTSRSVWDLGFKNAVYVRPAYPGDTLTKSFYVQSLRNTADGDGTIASIRCELFNQFGKLIFTLDKQMLFEGVTNPYATAASSAPAVAAAPAAAGGSGAAKRALPATSSMREMIIEHAQSLIFPASRPLVPRQCLLHVPVMPLGTSRHLDFCLRHRLTHPLHVNLARHGPTGGEEGVVVPGMAVVNLVHSATNRALYEVLHESVLQCSLLNPVAPNDAVGAVTYIEQIQDVPGVVSGRVSGLAEVRAVTIGVKNIDVCGELAHTPLPTELFTRDMRRGELDAYLKENVPALQGKVVSRSVRSLLRQSLFSRAEQIPLL